MEIVNIDKQTFDTMLSKFNDFATRLEYFCRLHGDKDKNNE